MNVIKIAICDDEEKAVALHERIRELQQENQRLRAENEKMQKALSRRNDKLLRNL